MALKKVHVVVFETGEEVAGGLLRFAKEHAVSSAQLIAIGALERVVLGFFDVAEKSYKRIVIDEQVELMSLIGNIARDEKGEPKVHAHVTVGKSDGTAHGGHLIEAHVRPTVEATVFEFQEPLHRRMRGDVGVALLDLSRESV